MSEPSNQARLADQALCIELALEVRERHPNRSLEEFERVLEEAWAFEPHALPWPEAWERIVIAHRLDWPTGSCKVEAPTVDEPQWEHMAIEGRERFWRLSMSGVEIARVWTRPRSGIWHATLSMHLSWQQRADYTYSSEQAARHACISWVLTNRAAVSTEINLERLSRGSP